MTVIEVLEAARARVEKGWGQGRAVSPLGGGPTCVGVAIERAFTNGGEVRNEARRMFCQAVAVSFGAVYGGEIVEWNDTPGRTQADVLAAFDKAIALARSAQ